MKLLLNERKMIIGMGSSIEYGVWGNVGDQASWKINQRSYVMDDNFTIIEVDDDAVPTYVHAGKFYYIDGEFKLADECPNEYRDRIVTLEDTVSIQEDTIAELVENSVDLAYELSLMELGLTE